MNFKLSLITRSLMSLFIVLATSACGGNDTDKNKADKSDLVTADAPAVGTNINAIAKPEKQTKAKQKQDYKTIAWEDLEVPGKGIDSIIEKYQKKIDAISEGDPREKDLLKEIQGALNAAPVNPELDGQKIRIPGFVSPLEIDQQKGVVKDFLLVPYFGACIHVPPPPMNQTLLIQPGKGQGVSLDETHIPVWVTGTIKADSAVTELAEAGYQIKDAKIEMYREEEESVPEDDAPKTNWE